MDAGSVIVPRVRGGQAVELASRAETFLPAVRQSVDLALREGSPARVEVERRKIVALERVLRRRVEYLALANRFALERLRLERWLGDYLSRTVRRGSHRQKLPKEISRRVADACRLVAGIPEETFETVVAAHAETDEITTRAVLRWAGVLRPRRKGKFIPLQDDSLTIQEVLGAFPHLRERLAGVPPRVRVVGLVIEGRA
jgi:hypothetical protein